MLLLVASGNAHKVAEIAELLRGSGWQVLSLRDFPDLQLPPEDAPPIRKLISQLPPKTTAKHAAAAASGTHRRLRRGTAAKSAASTKLPSTKPKR